MLVTELAGEKHAALHLDHELEMAVKLSENLKPAVLDLAFRGNIQRYQRQRS